MHLHKFFHYCQLVQAGAKEVPGELVKYLKVNSACHWASFVFLQTVSKHPEPCPVGTHPCWGHCIVQYPYFCFI